MGHVGYAGPAIAYSTDAITWTGATGCNSFNGNYIAYNRSIYLAQGISRYLLKNANGTSWRRSNNLTNVLYLPVSKSAWAYCGKGDPIDYLFITIFMIVGVVVLPHSVCQPRGRSVAINWTVEGDDILRKEGAKLGTSWRSVLHLIPGGQSSS